jgi:O-antigen ligase
MTPRFPISIDPPATALELFRLAGILAAFTATALLVRSHTRRVFLASVLCASALFQTFYGVREAALGRYEIWGWVNRLIFNRVTGTFVNPNHYAHYLAIVVPMALFLAAAVWRRSGAEELTAGRRLALLFERGIVLFSFAILAAVACLGAMLLAQSRGALLALGGGVLTISALLPGKRIARVALGIAAGLVIFGAMVLFLGTERTVARFAPNQFEVETLVGRRVGIASALGIWNRFSLFGSGAGTFERVVAMEQRQDLDKTYHHAHNDYAEIAATTGTLGFVIAFVALIGGYVTLARMTFGSASVDLSWKRRAFQAAALCSLTIAMVHALFDFNLFIPSNPATLAAIAGAAVATTDHDKRTRR